MGGKINNSLNIILDKFLKNEQLVEKDLYKLKRERFVG